MRMLCTFSAAVLMFLSAACAPAPAADTGSGIEVGKRVGSYSATKCGGVEDGVDVGKSLCYTWKLGGRPVIFAFAKTPDDNLASLAKEIDKVVADNADKKLAAVINFTGELTDEYQEKVAEFAEKNGIKNIALTLTADGKKFNVADDAEVTVMHYKGKEVKFNFASNKSLDEKAVKSIVEGVKTVLE